MDIIFASLLRLINETLASVIVIVAASMLLYNLTRNLRDRVARTSALLLGCVTIAYIADVFLALGPGLGTYMATLRMQWIGIAFMPVALLHLSDALLATTGLPSRGRRRRIIRLLYLLSAGFLILAAFTDTLIVPRPFNPEFFDGSYASLEAGIVFPLYVLYFALATGIAFFNVQRARLRCLTRSTRRRMGYLQIAMLTPAVGIFPFSLLLGAGEEFSIIGLILVNIANIVVVLMLLFLAYPLSFFGTRVPDRLVKIELLRFMLRGPATGVLALTTILYITPATRILGLPGQAFLPFAVVAIVLLWQWMIALAMPVLEKRLVYSGEDYERMERLQTLSERLLTHNDLLQLQEATLSAVCDYLRVSTAFVAALDDDTAEIISAVGPMRPAVEPLQDEKSALLELFAAGKTSSDSNNLEVYPWHGFWVTPLTSRGDDGQTSGLLGIQARAAAIDLTTDERENLATFARRAARTLDDLRLQGEIYAALEGLLPQINITRSNAAPMEYRPPRPVLALPNGEAHSENDLYSSIGGDRETFREQVRAALRHYWGGPGLTSSGLLDLQVVRAALSENDNNPPRALRSVLHQAIQQLAPEGTKQLNSPEWTLYNLLELRTLKGQPTKEVATKLFLSDAQYYRKQNVAIAAVADNVLQMERQAQLMGQKFE